MKNRFSILLFAVLAIACRVYAHDDTAHINAVLRQHIDALAAPAMMGRGYVDGGLEKAEKYISNVFDRLGLQRAPGVQNYSFPVNTFPGKMRLAVDGEELVPGKDFLIDAGSVSYKGRNIAIIKKDIGNIPDVSSLKEQMSALSRKCAWYLEHTDSFCKTAGISPRAFAALLPRGCYIIPQKAKQIWTVSRAPIAATVFYVNEGAMPAPPETIDVQVQATYKPQMRCDNIIASVPGEIKDSFIVFSAHYDHLGKMGSETTFPGASDNASGSAMMLYLASYYATRPQKFTMVFIAFSGEEAGLMGSAYFVKHPTIPLSNIKFLTNVDIMGDATDGITVVNGTEYPTQFEALTRINDQNHYLPAVKSRGKAANSDHYHFSEAGVPAIFIYTNGGKGYYHDIYDKPGEITLHHVAGVATLLTDFVDWLQKR